MIVGTALATYLGTHGRDWATAALSGIGVELGLALSSALIYAVTRAGTAPPASQVGRLGRPSQLARARLRARKRRQSTGTGYVAAMSPVVARGHSGQYHQLRPAQIPQFRPTAKRRFGIG